MAAQPWGHIVFQAEAAKNKLGSYAPLSIRTRQTLDRYISEYKPTDRLFPNLTRNRAWEMVDKLAKALFIEG